MWEAKGREVQRLACSVSETDGREDLQIREENYTSLKYCTNKIST